MVEMKVGVGLGLVSCFAVCRMMRLAQRRFVSGKIAKYVLGFTGQIWYGIGRTGKLILRARKVNTQHLSKSVQ
jgi:hypothetical protein